MGSGQIKNFYDYINTNQNMTWYSIVWCTTEWKIDDDLRIPCNYGQNSKKDMMLYGLFFNFSLSDNVFMKAVSLPWPADNVLLTLKSQVDNSILRYLSKKKHF